MTRPRLLDLFCGAGGAAVGYARAGFDVVGVDINPQPHYPFWFWQGDAFEFPTEDFDAIHASPPCQAHTSMSNRWRGKGGKADERVDLIDATRARLVASGLPYVIENVLGARTLKAGFVLTGGMFGLGVHRPRLFESNVLIWQPPKAKPPAGHVAVYGQTAGRGALWHRKDGTVHWRAANVAEAQAAMGMDWCPDWRGIAEAIPPAYTEWIGRQLLAYLEVTA